jgi:presenilin-like A22 family membrane protease
VTEQLSPEQKEQDKFKFQIIYLAPILASMLFGLGCAYILALQPEEFIPPVTIIPETTPGAPIGNALYFVVLIAVAATVIYLLIKRRSKRIITAMIIVSLTTASLLLSFFYLFSIFAFFPPDWEILILPLMIAIAVLFDLAIFRLGGIARNIAVICMGGALGVFFGTAIPWWSAVVILAFLAVYDVIAVYKGPVGKIAQSGLDQLQDRVFHLRIYKWVLETWYSTPC